MTWLIIRISYLFLFLPLHSLINTIHAVHGLILNFQGIKVNLLDKILKTISKRRLLVLAILELNENFHFIVIFILNIVFSEHLCIAQCCIWYFARRVLVCSFSFILYSVDFGGIFFPCVLTEVSV